MHHARRHLLVFVCLACAAFTGKATVAAAAGDEIFRSGFETAWLFPDSGQTGADISLATWQSADATTRRTAMAYTGGGSGGPETPVRYGECTHACTTAADWQFVTLGSYGSGGLGGGARLALDGSGRPRVVWYSQSQVGGNGTLYYGECNAADCSALASWTIAALVAFTGGDSMALLARGAFALDPSGHPRLLLQDLVNGTFYGQCDTSCTDFNNWTYSQFTTITAQADLKFTSSGQPRVAYESLTSNVLDGMALFYAACNSNCGNESNWASAEVIGVDDNLNTHPFALALTSTDAPRIAFYYDKSGDYAHQLSYAWCDSDCFGAGWTAYASGLPLYSGYKGVALALDADDVPHLAYGDSPDGVDDASADLADCIQGCTSAPIWQWRDIITKDEVPFAPPDPCSTGLSQWQVGTAPDLAIDGGGKRYTFDTYAIFSCITGYDTDGNPIYTVDTYAGPVGYAEP